MRTMTRLNDITAADQCGTNNCDDKAFTRNSSVSILFNADPSNVGQLIYAMKNIQQA